MNRFATHHTYLSSNVYLIKKPESAGWEQDLLLLQRTNHAAKDSFNPQNIESAKQHSAMVRRSSNGVLPLEHEASQKRPPTASTVILVMPQGGSTSDDVKEPLKSFDYWVDPIEYSEIPNLLGWVLLVFAQFCIVVALIMLVPLSPTNGFTVTSVTLWSVLAALMVWGLSSESWLVAFPHLKRWSFWQLWPFVLWVAVLIASQTLWVGVLYLPFNSLLSCLGYQPCTLALLFTLTKEERNDPAVREKIKTYLLLTVILPGFYAISALYLVIFGYLAAYPGAQILVNLVYAVLKYVLKRMLSRLFHSLGGFSASNGAVLFMDLMHHSFTILNFLNRSSFVTIFVNLLTEALFILRIDLACSDRYQKAKQKVFKLLGTAKFDRFMDKVLYPSIEMTKEERIRVQCSSLLSTTFASIGTIIGFLLIVFISRNSYNHNYYPYSDSAMSALAFNQHISPLQGAVIVVVGTHTVLGIISTASLIFIKVAHPSVSVLIALRTFKDLHWFTTAAFLMAIAFSITFVMKHERYASFFFPQLYT
ncbi:hypothetical protein PROFUN_06326 [Planoprotostelium fungivorum]|uniref:Transmembrane protein n=1 Tax=Planoprotostelium fungivorum TaxID=1890364 RepID=A0A2P6NP52_9EUKA|nr:hypothetical protein PROFUN_06326 [Planoprotostelium fungivorum]